jgi:hypothetical protein
MKWTVRRDMRSSSPNATAGLPQLLTPAAAARPD